MIFSLISRHYLYEASNISEMVVTKKPQILSLYPEKIDGQTERNADESINIAIVPETMTKELKIMINGEVSVTVIDKGFISTAVPKEYLEKDLRLQIYDTLSGEVSEMKRLAVD